MTDLGPLSDGRSEAETPCTASQDDHRPAPRQNSQYAQLHLALLGRDKFEFRCLPDDKQVDDKRGLQRRVGTLDKHKKELRLLNEAGFGIFFQVNESDGLGHKDSNIVAARCFFADLDGAPRENIARLGLQPHMVLETSIAKYHAYWRVDDIPMDQYKSIQSRIAVLIGSDPAVCDKPRVMRLAGFLHQKNRDAPHLVQPIETGDHPPFDFVSFMEALSAAEEANKILPSSEPDRLAAPKTRNAPPLDIARSALQHLIKVGAIDPGHYDTWMRVGFALRTSYGEEGWQLFLEISSAAAGFTGESDCRVQWDKGGSEPSGKPLTILSYLKQARDTGWIPPGEQASGGRGKPDPAVIVLAQAEEAGDEHFLSPDGRPHVRFRFGLGESEHWRTTALESEFYEGKLRSRYHEANPTKVLAETQLKSAIEQFKATTRAADVRHAVHIRSALVEGRLYIDLCRDDGAAIEVDGKGWRKISTPPVRFLRGSRGALPEPQRGGTISDFDQHMPSLSSRDVRVLVAFAIGVLHGGGTYPLLLIQGGQGSFKSTLADMIVALVDPPATMKEARSSLATSEENLIVQAQNSLLLVLDNVSNFDGKASDQLCRLLSGGGFSKRKLYSDGTESRLYVCRPVIATSIEMPGDRGDLLDRSIIVVAQRTGQLRTEQSVNEAFERDKGKLLGVILDGLSAALGNKDAIAARVARQELSLPRLTDFTAVVEGAAEVLGFELGEFAAGLNAAQSDLQADSAAGDAVGAALVRYFSVPGAKAFDASAAAITAELNDGSYLQQQAWPPKNKLRGHLERIKPGLASLGIEVTFRPPHGKAKVWTMQIRTTDAFRPDRPVSDHF